MTRHLLICITVFTSIMASAQDLMMNSDNQCYISNSEKVYVDLDRKLLVAGDYLHYKAYLVNASSLKTDHYSKVLYYEIIDHNFRIMHSWRSNVQDGISIGETIIPDTIPEGIYQLRAFTNWMRNDNHFRFFSTTLIIVGISGEQENILRYRIMSLMEKYNLSTNYQKDNFIINVATEGGNFKVLIKSQLKSQNNIFNLVISSRGINIFKKEIKFDNNNFTMIIPANEIPPGVLLFEIIDKNQVTLARHLTFNPILGYEIKINNLQGNYQKNNKITIGLSIPDLDKSQKANLSVSIVEKSPFDSLISQSSISNYFLFNSEFGQPVSRYFNIPDTLRTTNHLSFIDYEWNIERIDQINYSYIKETRGYILSGRISNYENFKNLEYHILLLAKADSITRFKYTSPSHDGEFHFLIDSTFDNELLIIQDFEGETNDIKWSVENKWDHSKIDATVSQYTLDENQKQYLDYLHKISLVKKIYNNSYRMPYIYQKKFDDHNFFIPSYVVRPAEFEELPDFEEIASNLLPSIRFNSKKEEYYLSAYIKDHEKVFDEGVGLFLNGIPFSNLQYIASLSSLDIAKIEVTNKQVMHGDITFNGIVSIYTNKQNIQPSFLKNSFFFFDNKANPAILSTGELHALPGNSPVDNCLFWDPNIKLIGGETVAIELNTLNLESDYWILINGISDSGIPLYKIADFKVR